MNKVIKEMKNSKLIGKENVPIYFGQGDGAYYEFATMDIKKSKVLARINKSLTDKIATDEIYLIMTPISDEEIEELTTSKERDDNLVSKIEDSKPRIIRKGVHPIRNISALVKEYFKGAPN